MPQQVQPNSDDGVVMSITRLPNASVARSSHTYSESAVSHSTSDLAYDIQPHGADIQLDNDQCSNSPLESLLRRSPRVLDDKFAEDADLSVLPSKSTVIRAVCLKLTLLAVVIVASGILIYLHEDAIKSQMKKFLAFVQFLGYWGPLLIYIAYTPLLACFFPAELLIMSTGFVFTREATFGFPLGFAIATVCSLSAMVTSSAVDFFICRRLLFKPTQLLFRKYRFFRAFTRAVRDGGSRFVALIRLSPLVPFAVSNCLLGMTEIAFTEVLLGFPFVLPLVLLSIYVGACLGGLDDIASPLWSPTPLHIWIVVVGCVVAVVAMAYIGYLTSLQLHHVVENDQEDFLLQRSLTLHGTTLEHGFRDQVTEL